MSDWRKKYFAGYLNNSLDISIIFTLILLYFFSLVSSPLSIILKIFIVIGLITRIAWNYLFWAITTIILAVSHLPDWYTIDNHIYLMIYWSLTITIALYSSNQQVTLNKSASYLVGLCFLFATFWKVITPEFMNGSFFEYILAGGDSRFKTFSVLLTDMNYQNIEHNQSAINSVNDSLLTEHPGELIISSILPIKAQFLTYWTVIIEGLIGFLFLFPFKKISNTLKHYLLLLFIVTTYPIASVTTFGLLLVCIGISQAQTKKIRFLYSIAFLFLIIINYLT